MPGWADAVTAGPLPAPPTNLPARAWRLISACVSDLVSWRLAGASAGALLMGLTMDGGVRARLTGTVTVFVALALGAVLVLRPSARTALHLPFAGMLCVCASAVLAIAGLAALKHLGVLTEVEDGDLAMAAGFGGVTLVVAGAADVHGRRRGSVRTAVIGSVRSATSLDRELRLASRDSHLIIGRLASSEHEVTTGEPGREVPTLGSLGELDLIVEQRDIDLLVMTGEVSRLQVFDAISHSLLDQRVRLLELSDFYEEVFGHVPIAEINSAWFQYMMHPRYRALQVPLKRPLDITVALIVGTLSLPLIAVLALLIRLDGGPALFRQRRIGRGGQPFTVYKLRTMRVSADQSAQWASVDDPRITRLGRLLRKTHIDEFPQLLNVLRGEMTLVGPRPEQPEFVERLEKELRFYQRRHLLTPGITGWAQVLCGYAGSDHGSAWKLAHDLYYLKHRSLALDLMILLETLRTFFYDRSDTLRPASVAFILGAQGSGPDISGERAA